LIPILKGVRGFESVATALLRGQFDPERKPDSDAAFKQHHQGKSGRGGWWKNEENGPQRPRQSLSGRLSRAGKKNWTEARQRAKSTTNQGKK